MDRPWKPMLWAASPTPGRLPPSLQPLLPLPRPTPLQPLRHEVLPFPSRRMPQGRRAGGTASDEAIR